jgi:hypothetical protein
MGRSKGADTLLKRLTTYIISARKHGLKPSAAAFEEAFPDGGNSTRVTVRRLLEELGEIERRPFKKPGNKGLTDQQKALREMERLQKKMTELAEKVRAMR